MLDAVEAGDDETARELIAPLHPADIADLIELAARDEREGLLKALSPLINPDVLAELSEHLREELLEQIGTSESVEKAANMASSRLNRLSESKRKALLLSGLEGFSPEDVAYLLDTTAAESEFLVADAMSELERQTRSKVLVIEPSKSCANDLTKIVRGLGHAVTAIARTKREAVAAARAEEPDLILSEILLADGSSGIEAVKEISQAGEVPTIFITSKPELLIAGERPEPSFLIPKPYEAATVRSAIAQAIFFDFPIGSRLPPPEQEQVPLARSRPELRRSLRANPAPVDAVVIKDQLRLAPGTAPHSLLDRGPLEALRSDFREDVERLLQLGTNIGPAFAVRLQRLRALLEEPLSEASALRLANQIEALAEFKIAVEEALNPSDAADVLATVAALRKFVRQFPIWRAFQREAAEVQPLAPEIEDELRKISEIIEQQPDNLVAPELKNALAEVRETSEESGAAPAGFAFARGVSNVMKAVARYALDRLKGAGAEFNKSIDKELGGGLATTASNLLIGLGTPLVVLALHLPAEFSWVGPVIAILRQSGVKR